MYISYENWLLLTLILLGCYHAYTASIKSKLDAKARADLFVYDYIFDIGSLVVTKEGLIWIVFGIAVLDLLLGHKVIVILVLFLVFCLIIFKLKDYRKAKLNGIYTIKLGQDFGEKYDALVRYDGVTGNWEILRISKQGNDKDIFSELEEYEIDSIYLEISMFFRELVNKHNIR